LKLFPHQVFTIGEGWAAYLNQTYFLCRSNEWLAVRIVICLYSVVEDIILFDWLFVMGKFGDRFICICMLVMRILKNVFCTCNKKSHTKTFSNDIFFYSKRFNCLHWCNLRVYRTLDITHTCMGTHILLFYYTHIIKFLGMLACKHSFNP